MALDFSVLGSEQQVDPQTGLDFSVLEEFMKACDKSIEKYDIVFINYADGVLSMYSEEALDGLSVGASVLLEVPAEGDGKGFYSCVDAKSFLALVKKLYAGVVTMDFSKKKLEIKEGNIKASFSKVSGKKRHRSYPDKGQRRIYSASQESEACQ